jgi:hypothetical protein
MRLLIVALILLFCGSAHCQDTVSEVGYCSKAPCCEYEGVACSEHDNNALIANSRVVKGPKAFCSRLMRAHWHYIPLDLDHGVSREEASAYLGSIAAGRQDGSGKIWPAAGRFDINNDGKPEFLGWLQLYSGAGRGCDIEVYVELSKDRAHLKKSTLSLLLGKNSCRDYNRAFNFEGKTYIENRRTIEREGLNFSLPGILTEIIIIEGSSRRAVCTYTLEERKH